MASLKRVRGAVSHYLCFPSPVGEQLRVKRDLLGLRFLLPGKVRERSESPASPAVWDVVKEAHFFLMASRIHLDMLHAWGWGSAKGRPDRTLEWHQRDVDPTNWAKDSIKKLPTSHQAPVTHRSQLAYRHPQHTVCLTHAPCHPVASSLCALPMTVNTSLYRWPVSTQHRKLACLCGVRETTQVSMSTTPKKLGRGLPHPGTASQGWQEACNLKNSPVSGIRKCGAEVSTGNVWISFHALRGLMEGICLPKPAIEKKRNPANR